MAEQQLKRLLGKSFSIAVTVGGIVGLGILRTPGEIAETVSDPGLYMALWIGGGIFVMLSLLVIAELYAMTPKSGGVYALVAHAYGPYPGFVIGWIDWISIVAGGALKSVVLIEYLALLMPSLAPYTTPAAIAVTSLFALLQLAGVRTGGNIHQTATAIIGLSMLAITGAIFLAAGTADAVAAVSTPGIAAAAQYGLVVSAIVFTYDGWTGPSYFGSEIHGGGRQLATGAIRGMFIVIGIYVLLNFALVMAVPLSSLQGNDLAIAGALEILYGSGTAVIFVAIFILLTHQNLNYMFTSRVLYALSVDGLGTSAATGVSAKGTPSMAVLLSWMLCVTLILAGGFEFLLNMTAMMSMLIYISLVVGLFRLRRQEPDSPRPYTAWAFPFTGYICAAGWVALTVFVGFNEPASALWGVALIVASIPAYLILRKTRRKAVSVA